jgi:hypothetical protein
MKTSQIPPVRVTDEAMKDIESRAKSCGLNLTEYVRYRCYGKKVLTGEQVEGVKKQEKLID